MFSYRRVIRIQDTDATGVIYFANLLQIGLEAFEEAMRVRGFSLQDMIEGKDFLLPIVHTEGDFFAPLRAGDEIDVQLEITKVGTKSFTHTSNLFLKGEKMATTSTVHVAYSQEKKESIPLPPELKLF